MFQNKNCLHYTLYIYLVFHLISCTDHTAQRSASDDSAANSPSVDNAGNLSVVVNALTFEEVADACWTITTSNSSGQLWTTSVCGQDFGSIGANITYGGICDASDPEHAVSIRLNELRDEYGQIIDSNEYENPCPAGDECVETFTCLENEDVRVDFNIVLLLDANFGFIDTTVDVDAYACSAKVDCVDELLENPNKEGQRDSTVVVAVTCKTEACSYLYYDDLIVTCDEGTATVSPEGNQGFRVIEQTADILYHAEVYKQQATDQTNAIMINLGMNQVNNCTLQFAFATDASETALSDKTTPEDTKYPYISVDINLTDAEGELACGTNPLGGGTGVDVVFAGPEDETRKTFTHEQADSFDGCAPVCDCPEGFTPTPGNDACVKTTSIPAENNATTYQVCDANGNPAYGVSGALYEDTDGDSSNDQVSDPYWGVPGSSTEGRLNEIGIWACNAGTDSVGSLPVGEWIGFSYCLDIAVGGDYLIGIAGDNRVRFKVDGVTSFELDNGQTSSFNYWYVRKISLSSGIHVIELLGENDGSVAAFGAEISGPFSQGSLDNELDQQQADYANNIIFSTQNMVGQTFDIGESSGWRCPDETQTLNTCGQEPTCTDIEYVDCLNP